MILKKQLFLNLLFFLGTYLLSSAQGIKLMEKVDWSVINPATGNAQDFVVLPSGQVVYGTIVRNYNLTDYEEVSLEAGGKTTTYRPLAIQGFGLANGQVFLSKALPESSEPVFIQVLVSGPIHLGGYKGAYFLDNGVDYERLEPRYKDIEKDGPAYRKYVKPFLGTLKRYLPGDCGVVLFPTIDRLAYNDDALIRILSSYFDCTGSAYRVHIEEVPFIQISPIFGFGLSQFGLSPAFRQDGRADRFESKFGFQFFGGVRFHDSRKLPRVSTDLRIAFSSFQTQVLSSYDGGQFQRTGSETIRETAILVPVSLNYSVIKRPKTEVYLGVFAALWNARITGEDGRVDDRLLNRSEVFIYERPITVYQGSSYSSGARLGASFIFSEKLKFFAELEGSLQQPYYQFALLQNLSYYDRSRLTFQLGIEL